MVRSVLALLGLGCVLWPGSAQAGETCTIMYDLDGKFVVSDTSLGKGDASLPVPGRLLLEFSADDKKPTDGKVGILFFTVYQHFTIDTVVNVVTAVHDFAPTCDGERNPTWRKPSDPGFPKICGYRGNRRPEATGTLRLDEGRIEWDKCKAAPTYWSKDRDAYNSSSKSRGSGCLNGARAVGNVNCDGRLGCKIGNLQRGDNPIDLTWNQPLIAGPPGTPGVLTISKDLSQIESPEPADGGRGSYNLVNDAPSRTWLSFTGKRNERSPHTTCR